MSVLGWTGLLVGAIQLLEADHVVRLVAHHETGIAPSRQRALADALSEYYGPDRVALSQMFCGRRRRGSSNTHLYLLRLNHRLEPDPYCSLLPGSP